MIRDYNKYLVLKQEELVKVLTDQDWLFLESITKKVQKYRESREKLIPNRYVVVNDDEPYSEVVWNLITVFEDLKAKGRLR